MRRWMISTSLVAAVAVLMLISGCPQRQQTGTGGQGQQPQPQPESRVAGTQQQASTVTATLDAQGLSIAPQQVPAGAVAVLVRNTSDTARTVAVEGPGMAAPQTKTIPPNATETFTLENAAAGAYRVYVVGLTVPQRMRTQFAVTAADQGAQGQPGRVTATYAGTMARNTWHVGIRWIATRSATGSRRPARCLNIG